MTPRTITIPEHAIEHMLMCYDRYTIAKENGGGRLEEYKFWQYATEIIPEVAEGLWVFDTTRPLRPVFIELKGNKR